MIKRVVYPGSFDPVTNGHLDIIKRATKIFDEVIVAVLKNLKKKPLFSTVERVELLEKATKELENVKVDSFNGLTMDYVETRGATAIIRGLRAVSDFEGEVQMSSLNKEINSECRLGTIHRKTHTRNRFSACCAHPHRLHRCWYSGCTFPGRNITPRHDIINRPEDFTA